MLKFSILQEMHSVCERKVRANEYLRDGSHEWVMYMVRSLGGNAESLVNKSQTLAMGFAHDSVSCEQKDVVDCAY